MKTFISHLPTTMAGLILCLLCAFPSLAQKKQNKEKENQKQTTTQEGTIHLRIEKYENGQKKVYEHTYKDGELSNSGFSQGYLFDTEDSVATLKLFGGGLGDTSLVIHPSGKMFFSLSDSAFSNNHFYFKQNLDSILHSNHPMVFNFNHSFMPHLDSLLSRTMDASNFVWHGMNENFQFHFDTLLSNGFNFKWEDNFFDSDNLEMTLDKDKYEIEEIEVDGKTMIKIKPKDSVKADKLKDPKKKADNMQPFGDLLNLNSNAATGMVHLRFVVPEDGVTIITVTNAQGKKVYREKVKNKAGVFTKNIDLRKHGRGEFTVEISHNHNSTRKKIVIQ